MGNHTEGKWVFSDWVRMSGQGDVPTQIKGTGKPYGRHIASLNFDTTDTELSSDKVLANAKLIRSAPDLLEALEKVLTCSKFLPEDINDTVKEAIKRATE